MKVPFGWDVYMAVNGQPEFVPGAVFWNGDEWTYKDAAEYYPDYPDALTLALKANV